VEFYVNVLTKTYEIMRPLHRIEFCPIEVHHWTAILNSNKLRPAILNIAYKTRLRPIWSHWTRAAFLFIFGSATPCASPPPWTSIFSDYSFWVHHSITWHDRHLLAHAMASDLSVTWQCLSKRTTGFCYESNSMPITLV
jgi:hypothetical protein